MSWIDQAVRDFGYGMGIADLAFEGDGPVCLDFERRGRLCIERVPEAVLVHLTRRLEHPPPDLFRRALEACHYEAGHPLPVQAGLHGEDGLVLLTRIKDGDVSLPVLERAFDLLTQLHQRLGS
jgi:type III secretion system chaperone SycN